MGALAADKCFRFAPKRTSPSTSAEAGGSPYLVLKSLCHQLILQKPARTKHRHRPSLLRTHCGLIAGDPGARVVRPFTACEARTALASAAARFCDGALPEYVTRPSLQKRAADTGEATNAMHPATLKTAKLRIIVRPPCFTVVSIDRLDMPSGLFVTGRSVALRDQRFASRRTLSPRRERSAAVDIVVEKRVANLTSIPLAGHHVTDLSTVGVAGSLLVLYREYKMPPASRVNVTTKLTSGGIFPMICCAKILAPT